MTIKGVLLDLGGVVYVGEALIPGATEAIDRLRGEGLHVRFLTNVTRQSASGLRAKLEALGLTVAPDELFTPAIAARNYIEKHGLRPHLLVHPELESEFSGLKEGAKDAVVIGDAGKLFKYDNLNRAFRVLNGSAPLIALAANKAFRDEDGLLSLDAGAFVMALSYASGKEPVVLGKPSKDFFELALDSMDCTASEAVMVGDDAEADVGGALAAGLKGVLVRTGKYEKGAEEKINPPPTAVVADLAAAAEWICSNK